MWRWFRWVLLGTVILIIIILAGLYFYYFYWIKLHGQSLSDADKALASGITVLDSKDDFVMLGSNKEELNAEDNPSPYRLDMLDIKSVSLGADNQYLYFKETFYGVIPKKAPVINGDTIQDVGAKGNLRDKSGKEYGGIEVSFGWLPIIGFAADNTYYFYGPTGVEWPESARYTGQGNDSKVYGGVGTDYIMGRFPLARFGLKMGDTINIELPTESGSAKYSHAAVDVLQGKGKTPGLITWTLGTNAYTINNNTEETSQQMER